MVVTRFAPSPTGALHIGGLRTALYSYLHARQHGGKFLLRIEDTDAGRNDDLSLQGIFDALNWAELEYDEPPLYQSKRLEVYSSYIKKLLNEGKAYQCYLSREDIEAGKLNQSVNRAAFTRCYRDFTGKVPGVNPSVRMKIPLGSSLEFRDELRGSISIDTDGLDDFVIARSDGTPTYNFVVAIDDALSGVTDVIRGDDHLSNTPKQVLIYSALRFPLPKFYHIPVICNESGKKLSKRDGALGVLEYRDRGVLKDALLNFLFRLGFSSGNREVFTKEDMLDCFNLLDINRKPSLCNFSKLDWLCSEHMKMQDSSHLESMLQNKLLESIPVSQRRLLIDELKCRVKDIREFNNHIDLILKRPFLIGDAGPGAVDALDLSVSKDSISDIASGSANRNLACSGLCSDASESVDVGADELSLLSGFCDVLKEYSEVHDLAEVKRYIRDYANSRGIKVGTFMQLLRYALLGTKNGVDIAVCVCVLGKIEVLDRAQFFIDMKS